MTDSSEVRPKPLNALLAEMKAKHELKSKKKKKNLQIKVRTRDGKIYNETINADGKITKTFHGKEILHILSEQTSKQLHSYLYDSLTKRWQRKKRNISNILSMKDDQKNNSNINVNKNNANENSNKNELELCIMSYNIWFSNFQWQERLQKLLSMLMEIKPDIFCFQEITEKFMKVFCDHKYIQENYELSECKLSLTVIPYGVIIGVKRIKQLSDQSSAIYLSMYDLKISQLNSNMGRRFLSVCVQISAACETNENIIESDDCLWVNTVHLESMANRELRMDQLQNIFVLMKDQKDSLFMGDFNFGDYGIENKCLSKEYKDCWLEYCAGNGSSGGDTICGSRFDRILLKSEVNDGRAWKVKTFDIIGKVHMPSDHLGVVVSVVQYRV